MRRSTLITLIIGAGTAMFSYTPTAAQWLAIGREQGHIPEQIPAEMTDPPVVAAGALTLFVTLAVMLFRFLYVRMGASGFEVAVATQAVQQSIEDQGRQIISNRMRLKDNQREVAEAEIARVELMKERAALVAEVAAGDTMLKASKLEIVRQRDALTKAEADHNSFDREVQEKRDRLDDIHRNLSSLGAVKSQLLVEQRQLS